MLKQQLGVEKKKNGDMEVNCVRLESEMEQMQARKHDSEEQAVVWRSKICKMSREMAN